MTKRFIIKSKDNQFVTFKVSTDDRRKQKKDIFLIIIKLTIHNVTYGNK